MPYGTPHLGQASTLTAVVNEVTETQSFYDTEFLTAVKVLCFTPLGDRMISPQNLLQLFLLGFGERGQKNIRSGLDSKVVVLLSWTPV